MLKDFFDDRDPAFSVYGPAVHDDKIEETAEMVNAAVCGKGNHPCGPCDCKQKTSSTLFKELDLPFLGGCQGRERR